MVFKKETGIEGVRYGTRRADENGDNLEYLNKFTDTIEKLTGNPTFANLKDDKAKIQFFNGEFVVNNSTKVELDERSEDDYIKISDITLWRPSEKKIIALDFMGTMNQADSKRMLWQDVQEQIVNGNTNLLKKAGITEEQLKEFKEYSKDHSAMELRQYMLSQKEVKQAFGRYTSIAAEEKGFDYCKATQDTIDFLTIANILGHTVEIFSTVGAPEGYKNLQQIVLEQQKLSDAYSRLTGKQNVFDLITGGILVSKLKKSEPGKAVFEETKNKGLTLYADDEPAVISSINDAFLQSGETEKQILPILCQIDRTGKPLTYENIRNPGITKFQTAQSLTDSNLLHRLYGK